MSCPIQNCDCGQPGPQQSLYYEVHVTIAYPEEWHTLPGIPVDVRFMFLKDEAKRLFDMRMGDLYMIKGDTPSQKDVFFTTRSQDRGVAELRMRAFIEWVKHLGHPVLRYKIEDTVLDSKVRDELGLL